MADAVTAVDADRLARPFVWFLAAMLVGAVVAFAATFAGTLPAGRVVTAYALWALGLVVALAGWTAWSARRYGRRVDRATARRIVRVQDLSAWAILATAVGVAVLIALRFPAWPPDWPTLLVAGLGITGLVAAVRLATVELWLTPDAVLRVPRGGLANRYPLAGIEAVDVDRWLLRVRVPTPLGDWTCLTRRAAEIQASVAALSEEE